MENVGTHFIASEEAGFDRKSKEVYVNAKRDDVTVIKSPVGLPVRVLKTPLVNRVPEAGRNFPAHTAVCAHATLEI